MKNIIILLIMVMATAANSQDSISNTSEEMSGKTRLYVEVQAKSRQIVDADLLESKLFISLGELMPLNHLELNQINGKNTIRLSFKFRDLNSFYQWYKTEKVKALFDILKSKFDIFEVDLKYTKVI